MHKPAICKLILKAKMLEYLTIKREVEGLYYYVWAPFPFLSLLTFSTFLHMSLQRIVQMVFILSLSCWPSFKIEGTTVSKIQRKI